MPSTSIRRIRVAEIPATPWKNGGGVTREIATGAAADTGNGAGSGWAWGWRVSIAEVAQDGPFSIFPGVDRVIAVIEGAGMDLVAPDGRILPLEPFQPVAFSGDDALFGRLRGGALRDLNVMVQRRHCTATMDIAQGPRKKTWQGVGGNCLLVHSLAGRCTVTVDGDEAEELTPSDTLLHEGPGSVVIDLADGGRAAVIQIRRS